MKTIPTTKNEDNHNNEDDPKNEKVCLCPGSHYVHRYFFNPYPQKWRPVLVITLRCTFRFLAFC